MMNPVLLTVTLFAGALGVSDFQPSSPLTQPKTKGTIQWEANWAAAKEKAAQEKRVLFLAVNMDGERANDRLATRVYRDKDILKLTEHTVAVIASAHQHSSRTCKRFGTITCAEHQGVDIKVRAELLPKDAGGFVVAPQHVFMDPAGQVLLSVPYEITAAELEWCLVEAIRRVDPESNLQASGRARAPKRLVEGGLAPITGEESAAPATREEVLELIAKVRKGNMANREQALRRIMTADEKEARDFIVQELRRGSGRGGGRGGRGGGGGLGGWGGSSRNEAGDGPWARQELILRTIARLSPASWWVVIEEFALSTDEDLRSEAIAALEQLASPDSVKLIQSGLRKERNERLEGNWLRALASCSPDDSKVASKLLKIAAKEKSLTIQVQCVIALGWLVPSENRKELLTELLEEGEPDLREAAAIAAGLTREETFKGLLESHQAEAEGDLKIAIEAALLVWEKGSLAPLGPLVEETCADDVPRERFFGQP